MIGPPNSLPTRMARSALGDPELYEELGRDPSAIRQAVFVVALVTIVHGIISAVAALYGESDVSANREFFYWGLFTLSGWALSALFSFLIVSLIASTSASGFLGGTFLQFVRSAGFTASPGLLLILTPATRHRRCGIDRIHAMDDDGVDRRGAWDSRVRIAACRDCCRRGDAYGPNHNGIGPGHHPRPRAVAGTLRI